MSARGRSRTVSPIALGPAPVDHKVADGLAVDFVAPTHLGVKATPRTAPRRTTRPSTRDMVPEAVYPIPTQPIASSSRLEPCPPFR